MLQTQQIGSQKTPTAQIRHLQSTEALIIVEIITAERPAILIIIHILIQQRKRIRRRKRQPLERLQNTRKRTEQITAQIRHVIITVIQQKNSPWDQAS